MTQDILDAVAKSLPVMQMELLRKELENAARVPDLEKRLKDREQEISKLNQTAQHHWMADQKLKEAKERYEDAFKKEAELKYELLKKDYECEKHVNANLKELMHAVFKNSTVRKNAFISKNESGSSYSNSSESVSETVEVD